MTLINYLTRIHFADGVLEEALWGEMSESGRTRPLIITDPRGAGRDAQERLLWALPAKAETRVFEDCPASPTEAAARRLAAEFQETGRDSIIVLGGRGAVDFAKIARLVAADSRPLADLARSGVRRLDGPLPDLIAVPTMSGYGASVGAFAPAVTVDGRRMLASSHRLIPTVAICDPTLTLQADARESASAGAEALASCAESYLAHGYNPPAEGIALDGLRRAIRNLYGALGEGRLAERREISAASLNGALAQQKGPGVVYALVNALSAASRAAPDSGAISRLVLPGALRMIAAGNDEGRRAEAVRGLLGLAAEQGLAEGMERLLAALPMPARLSEMGVERTEITCAAREAARDLALGRNATPVSGDQLLSLLQAVF